MIIEKRLRTFVKILQLTVTGSQLKVAQGENTVRITG